MIYKNTKELKEIFGIDITEKNRTIPHVALRCFYSEMRVEQLTGNISSRYVTIAKEIGCNRDNLYNMLSKAETLRKDKSTKVLFEAFKNKDKSLFEQYLTNHKEYRKQYHKNWDKNKAMKTYEPPKVIKVFAKIEKRKSVMSNLKLAEYLRANNLLKHDVWDTPVRNISPNQWQQVKKINPIMFESIINH
jgi:hypothetical protein